MRKQMFFSFILITLVFATLSGAQVVGSASIKAPAVLGNNTGNLTQFSLTVTRGNGSVVITGPTTVGQDTLQSAQTAAQYASSYLHINEKRYNFNYTIANTDNVSGPSAGAAMTMLALSALQSKPFWSNNFTITGTISQNGSIGLVGGVYDKSQAASAAHLKYILVPKAVPGSFYNELYLLIQDNFNIPLIQVANISQAYDFAFNNAPIKGNLTSFNFYTNYNVQSLQNAPLSCSNGCSTAPFMQLANNTFNLTALQISNFALDRNFTNATMQLNQLLNESRQISAKGYVYTAADIAFLEFTNAYLMANNDTSIAGGHALLTGISSYCSDIVLPQQTTTNYEYLLQANLRQLWGLYTANQTIAEYNATVATSDDVLALLSKGAEAEGWCGSADKSYQLAAQLGGYPSTFNASLGNVAYQRLSRAKSLTSDMYTTTAQQAYNSKQYAITIIDSDYSYSFQAAATFAAKATVAQILNSSSALARNSTYGAWATQFANEAEFYIQQAKLAKSQTNITNYADEAYTSAFLASQISNDTRIIASSQIAAASVQPGYTSQQNVTALNDMVNKLYIISLMVLTVGMGVFGLLVGMLIMYVNNHHKHQLQHKLLEQKRMSRRKRETLK